MSDKLNRRASLAGAAAVPALAIPAAGAAPAFAAASEPDPVFATVAAHRDAFVEHMRAARLDGKLMRNDPRAEATGAALDAADEALEGATLDLSEVVPTTMAGVVALLRYLEEFQEQAIELPEAPRQWHSGDHDALLTELMSIRTSWTNSTASRSATVRLLGHAERAHGPAIACDGVVMSARRSKVVNIRPHLKAARIRASKNLDAEARYLVSLLPEPVARAIMLAALKVV